MKCLLCLLAPLVTNLFAPVASSGPVPGGVPAVVVGGGSIASGQWPELSLPDGSESPLSGSQSLAGYIDLGTVLVERVKGRRLVVNTARAGTTSYDLPNGVYDAVGDGSIPHWPGLKGQFRRGYRQSQVATEGGLVPTATHFFISLPDDCYFAEDFAVPGCVDRMIANTEEAVAEARSKGLVVIVELQNDLANLNIASLPGLITVAQYQALAQAWNAAFSGREAQKVYSINLYRAAWVNPRLDLHDGLLHLKHAAMVRAADRLLNLIETAR